MRSRQTWWLALVMSLGAVVAGSACVAGDLPSVAAPSSTAFATTTAPTVVAPSPIATRVDKTSDPIATIIRCGTLAANSVQSGQGAGPDVYELRSATGVSVARFLWPARQAELGSYLCVRLIAGAPTAGFDALVRPGEPGYVTQAAAASPSPSLPPGADQVSIGGRSYRIGPESSGTYLWRDFMPISPPDGRPLAASIRVVAVDGAGFPSDITVDRVWVHGPGVWETAPAEVRRAPDAGTPPSQIEVFANEGPKWDPGIEVDVVVRMRSGGASYFLRATGLEIRRTT